MRSATYDDVGAGRADRAIDAHRPSLGDFGFDARSLGGTLLLGACRAVPASDVIFEVNPSDRDYHSRLLRRQDAD
jgi:hypothetical protein